MATPPVGPHQEYSMLPFNNHSDDKAAEGLGIDGMLLDGVDFSKLAGVGIDGNTLNDNLFAGLSLTDSLSSTYSNLPVSLNNFSTNPFGFDFFSASSIGGMTEGSVPISASASTDTNITEDTVTDDTAGAACTGVDSSRSSLSSSLLLATTEEEKASAPLTADLIDTTTLLSPEETNLSYDERIGDTATFTNDCTSPNVGSKKRNRINAGQLMVLEKAFTDSPSPSSKMRTSIAGQCHMTERSVQIWFQNRRAKARNAQRKSESPGSTAATALHTSASMFSGAVPLVMPGAALNFAALKTKSDLVNKTGQQGSTTIVNAPTTNTINNNNNNNSSSNDSDQSQSNVSSSHNSHNNSINIHGNNNSHNSKQPSNITTSQSNYSQIIFPIMTATATTNQQNQQQQQQQQTKLVNGLSNIMPPNIPMDQSYLLSNTRNINLVSNDVVKTTTTTTTLLYQHFQPTLL
ncbi:homeobox domain-containing protein [Syncephalis fuscata]|nr:homeobox domain-containing protein [Syncephalis fuscata]